MRVWDWAEARRGIAAGGVAARPPPESPSSCCPSLRCLMLLIPSAYCVANKTCRSMIKQQGLFGMVSFHRPQKQGASSPAAALPPRRRRCRRRLAAGLSPLPPRSRPAAAAPRLHPVPPLHPPPLRRCHRPPTAAGCCRRAWRAPRQPTPPAERCCRGVAACGLQEAVVRGGMNPVAATVHGNSSSCCRPVTASTCQRLRAAVPQRSALTCL